MFKLHVADQISIPNGLAASASDGFTTTDLVALREVHATAIALRLWGHGQLVANEFAHYLAVWGPATRAAVPPVLALARFKKTGTYVLTIGSTFVASGKSLADVLPALSSRFGERRLR
jgi:hypothetical protein